MNGNNDNAVQELGTPDISEEYLSAFRQCLRITSRDFDGEITDYRGETRVEHEGQLYEVVWTYTRNGEKYELNCKQAAEPQDGTDGDAEI